jgi:hypothetical protein
VHGAIQVTRGAPADAPGLPMPVHNTPRLRATPRVPCTLRQSQELVSARHRVGWDYICWSSCWQNACARSQRLRFAVTRGPPKST